MYFVRLRMPKQSLVYSLLWQRYVLDVLSFNAHVVIDFGIILFQGNVDTYLVRCGYRRQSHDADAIGRQMNR